MNLLIQQAVLELTGTDRVKAVSPVQSLWSDYGEIVRVHLCDVSDNPMTVIVKRIEFPESPKHPRGWSTQRSHERKVRSYQVEERWYHHYAGKCDDRSRVARYFGSRMTKSGVILVMEDLDAAGFDRRVTDPSWSEVTQCLRWLAWFHGQFLGTTPEGLWPQGTYWHLDTRPDELEALTDIPLKATAKTIDELLTACPFQTLVHGDAKLANFCFNERSERVAAVDFQYVGGGCGMKDVAYFLGSCYGGNECEEFWEEALENYFTFLQEAVRQFHPAIDFDHLRASWEPMYAVAWADFHRFVKGWNPASWKVHSYSERLSRQVVSSLNQIVSSLND